MNQPELVAAVDLGSNSFRMEVGRTAGQQIYTVDALREPVRLAQGLTKDKKLDRDAFARGLATLDRFGERLRGFDKRRVRAVATNTLRVARNAPEFVREGEARLGFPIEVIAGREEARLIYSGVAHSLEAGGARRLVVDIGGGSTELIVGTGYEPEVLESVYVGCVGTSVRFFPDGNYTKASIKEAELSARRELEPFSKSIRKAGWTEAIGSSGTARALADLIHANFGIRGISADGLERLRAALIRAGRASELWLEGLKPDRVPVLAGGLAIMSAVFSEFKIDYMSVSDGALRTGVLYDLLGRTTHAADMRETTVARFMTRYRVDELHATSVARLATSLWESLVQASLDRESGHADEAQAAHLNIDWAARLHEIGLSISHSGYHKHSAYIVSNADMPGFAKREQAALATLVLGHTGKLPKLRELVAAEEDWRCVLCIRLAALFYRSRNYDSAPPVKLGVNGSAYQLAVPRPWLDANPLTEFDLRTEIEEWQRLGKQLELVGSVA